MKFKVLAIAAALAVSAAASLAQQAPTIPLTFSSAGPGMLTASFDSAVNGLFIDTFSFTPAAVSGNVSVDLMPLTGTINFVSALLNGDGFSFLPENGASNFSFQSVVSSSQPLQLQVFGFGGSADPLSGAPAAYRGTINVAAVSAIPEPETFALMFAGLGLVGYMARRKRGQSFIRR